MKLSSLFYELALFVSDLLFLYICVSNKKLVRALCYGNREWLFIGVNSTSFYFFKDVVVKEGSRIKQLNTQRVRWPIISCIKVLQQRMRALCAAEWNMKCCSLVTRSLLCVEYGVYYLSVKTLSRRVAATVLLFCSDYHII